MGLRVLYRATASFTNEERCGWASQLPGGAFRNASELSAAVAFFPRAPNNESEGTNVESNHFRVSNFAFRTTEVLPCLKP